VVDADHLQSPWIPDTKVVDGVAYCRVNKWDRGFVRFATAKTLKEHQNANVQFVDELIRLRNNACDALFRSNQQPAQTEQHEADGQVSKKRRQAYVRKARSSDGCFLPASMTMVLPDVARHDGEVLRGFECKVLFEGIRTSNLYIEMNADVMNYIYCGVSCCGTKGRAKKKGRPHQPSNHTPTSEPHTSGDE
jgi:hypothetical protein